MIFDIKELHKALALAKTSNVNIKFDPKERLIIEFTDPIGEIPHEITLYPLHNDQATKFAEIKITKRL